MPTNNSSLTLNSTWHFELDLYPSISSSFGGQQAGIKVGTLSLPRLTLLHLHLRCQSVSITPGATHASERLPERLPASWAAWLIRAENVRTPYLYYRRTTGHCQGLRITSDCGADTAQVRPKSAPHVRPRQNWHCVWGVENILKAEGRSQKCEDSLLETTGILHLIWAWQKHGVSFFLLLFVFCFCFFIKAATFGMVIIITSTGNIWNWGLQGFRYAF